jgi:ferritin-like metal-binding protein YciE
MPGKLSNPRDLFLQLLSEVLWLERTLVRKVLPKLAREAQSESLAAAFAEHLEQTRHHVARVEEVFALMDAESSSSLDEAVERLAAHHGELAGAIVDPILRDAFHAAGAAKTEHYELAAYEALIGLARALDAVDAVRLLEANRDEEAAALERVQAIGARVAAEAAVR